MPIALPIALSRHLPFHYNDNLHILDTVNNDCDYVLELPYSMQICWTCL